MRQFIRHPTDIPISLVKSEHSQQKDSACGDGQSNLLNISYGGLACSTARPLAVGERVSATVLIGGQSFDLQAQVMWCRYDDLGYEVGLRFQNAEDAFTARMVEQICHIEHYKREVFITEGRLLSADQAAGEWISKFAKCFPNSAESDHD